MCEQGGNIECVNRVAILSVSTSGNIECVNRWQY